MTDLTERALSIAIGQIGQQEHPRGSNWGHPVQDYLTVCGYPVPGSWCMAFMYWCFQNAADQFQIKNPMYKHPGVLAQWNNRVSNQIKPAVIQDVEACDLIIFDHGHGLGHTGIVEKIDVDAKIIHTIEGNTNDTGAREGYEVIRKERKFDNPQLKGFLRF